MDPDSEEGHSRSVALLDSAEGHLKNAVEIEKERLGASHLTVALTTYHLATVLEEQGRRDESESHYRAALGIAEKALGVEHADVARYQMGLGSVLHKMERNDEAAAIRAVAARCMPHTDRTLYPVLRRTECSSVVQ